MKRLFTFLAVLLFTTTIWAQNPPQKMSYQAVIRDDNGVLVKSHAVGMRISILKDEKPIYEETHVTSTNANGLVTIEIGGGNFVSGVAFSTIDWSSGTYSIKTETDPLGGTNYTAIIGTSQLFSVPYSFYTKTAASYSETDPNSVLLTGDQTVAGNKTFTGRTTVQTPVSATDAATKEYVDALLQTINQLESQPGIIKDVDGNLYTTIKIGMQVWMSENLKTTRYKDGSVIPLVTDNTAWSNLTTPGYCWYSNNEASNKNTYGALYNWYTVNAGSLCPAGWHVPTQAEWTTLENYLKANGYNYDGTTTGNKIAKVLASTVLWISSSTAGAVGNIDYPAKRNATGFTALPGGYRSFNGLFLFLGSQGDFWLATEVDATTAWIRNLNYDKSSMGSTGSYKQFGLSVRCVRD